MASAIYTLADTPAPLANPIVGLHDRPATLRLDGEGPGDIAARATFTCRTADLDDGAGAGDELAVDGYDYEVIARMDDGAGMTLLELRRI